MQDPTATVLLQTWESGLRRSPVERALLLAALTEPASARSAVAQWSIGQRDARLLDLRERWFGGELASRAVCPGCSERLEFQCQVSDLRCAPPKLTTTLSLRKAGYALRFRLPNSLDLLAVAQDGEQAARNLFQRCLAQARRSGKPDEPVNELPDELIDAAIARMAAADPQADVQLALRCPACDLSWSALFDIAAFLWQELHVWAARLLREVHLLAAAYGWREADILALSPARRQCYLELLGDFS